MSTPPPLAPPPDGDVNHGPALIAIFWVEIGLSIGLVSARFYIRSRMRALGADDWTILATLVMYITTLSLCTVLITFGLGRHVYYLTPEQQLQMARWNWIVQPFGILTLPLGKVSVVLLLERIMSRDARWSRAVLWINMILFTAVMIVASIISFAQCNPPSALWDPQVAMTATCWNPRIQADLAAFGSAYSAFLDFLLALFPLSFIRGLNMSSKKKFSLAVLLGMGVLSGICASVKTSQSTSLGARSDISWVLFSLYAWSSSEIFLNIVCACIPTLRPIYLYFVHGTPISSQGYGSEASSFRRLRPWTSQMKSSSQGSSWTKSGNRSQALTNHSRSQASESAIMYQQELTVHVSAPIQARQHAV